MTSRLPGSAGTKPRPMRSLLARACRPSITGIAPLARFPHRYIVPASNFGGAGILPVGSKQDMSPWGNYDMAGNVKEWIWTEAESGKRYVLGGAWDEPNYMFIDPDAQSPFLRAANIGFRCVKYIEPESIPKVATESHAVAAARS